MFTSLLRWCTWSARVEKYSCKTHHWEFSLSVIHVLSRDRWGKNPAMCPSQEAALLRLSMNGLWVWMASVPLSCLLALLWWSQLFFPLPASWPPWLQILMLPPPLDPGLVASDKVNIETEGSCGDRMAGRKESEEEDRARGWERVIEEERRRRKGGSARLCFSTQSPCSVQNMEGRGWARSHTYLNASLGPPSFTNCLILGKLLILVQLKSGEAQGFKIGLPDLSTPNIFSACTATPNPYPHNRPQ